MRFSRDNLIVLGIVAVVTLVYVLVIYRTQSRRLDEAQSAIAAAKRQMEADSAKAARVAPLIRDIEGMKQRYGKEAWDRRLPQQQELAGFLREISTDLGKESLCNQMIQPGNPSRAALYNCLPITMKFEGGFLALAGFLRNVDGMTRLTRVERLAIVPQRDGDGLSVELGMNLYFTEQ
jgi:Tfp pilus assembly protein PilO